MTFFINPMIFYWMDVASTVSIISAIGLFFSAIAVSTDTLCYTMAHVREQPTYKVGLNKRSKVYLTTIAILISLAVFIPSESTMIKMLVASQVTTENYEFAKEEVTDLIDYITEKIDNKGEEQNDTTKN